MIDSLNFDIQLSETLTKLANAIGSVYLVRHLRPLKAVFLNHLFCRISISVQFVFQSSAMSVQRVNRQIKWGIKVCQMRKSLTLQEIYY